MVMTQRATRLGDAAAAVDLATRALALRPTAHEALYARARAHRDARRPDAARTDLRRALQLAPRSRELRRMLAQVETLLDGGPDAGEELELSGQVASDAVNGDAAVNTVLTRQDSLPEETPL